MSQSKSGCHQRTTEEWLSLLEGAGGSGRSWLESLPPRPEEELLQVHTAKQLAEETCQFAMSVMDAAKRGHATSAYGNLRLLTDRFLHAVWFLREPTETIAWMRWSMAGDHSLVSKAISHDRIGRPYLEALRVMLEGIRRQNRSEESGKRHPVLRPSQYDWNRTRRKISDEATSRFGDSYDLFSTYVHPTFHGFTLADRHLELALERATSLTCMALIACAALLVHYEEDPQGYRIDRHLSELIEMFDDLTATGMEEMYDDVDEANMKEALDDLGTNMKEMYDDLDDASMKEILDDLGTRMKEMLDGRGRVSTKEILDDLGQASMKERLSTPMNDAGVLGFYGEFLVMLVYGKNTLEDPSSSA